MNDVCVDSYRSSIKSFALMGQCSSTYMLFQQLTRRCRLKPSSVVVSQESAEYDPFPDLQPLPASKWAAAHAFFHYGWRDELRAECRELDVRLIECSDPCSVVSGVEALIVAGFAQRVPDAVLARFGGWALNVHPAYLPRFRGPQPEAQFILSGEWETGVTIHSMTSRFDAGPIIAQHRFTTTASSTVSDIEKLASRFAADMLREILARSTLHLASKHSSNL